MAENGRVEWQIDTLKPGDNADYTINLQSPYTYANTLVRDYFVEFDDARSYGPLQHIVIDSGTVPIEAARTLVGNIVTIEGTATMYTGGFFAGTTGVKFYIEDETGGVQVYVPGGMDRVKVDIGDFVQVTGEIEEYRDSIEVIPETIPDDVEIIGQTDPFVPTNITVAMNEGDDSVIGRLNVIEGTATRIEEFTYSYEMDITDDEGNSTLVYIEKDTDVTAEPFEVGERYRVTGISEFYSSQRQLKPRVQEDVAQIFPPILRLEMRAANNVEPGATLAYTITAYNHTEEPLTNLRLTAVPPTVGASVKEIMDGGQLTEAGITWQIDSLAGNGADATVHYSITVDEDMTDLIQALPAAAVTDERPETVSSQPYLTFIGDGVPIWAIQGDGDRSPYRHSIATTEGIVSGVFPELAGFWIQEINSDDDPATSAGLFVLYDSEQIPVNLGDQVQVKGKVREMSAQTTLHVTDPEKPRGSGNRS